MKWNFSILSPSEGTKGLVIFLFYSILLMLYNVQHWKSTATCAAALELPNLNYAHMDRTDFRAKT